MAACWFGQSVLMAEEALLSFEAHGVVSCHFWLRVEVQKSEFRVTVKDDQWRITLMPESQSPTVPAKLRRTALERYELSSDSTNLYEIRQYREGQLQESHPVQHARRWRGSILDARGSEREARALWYAFASSRYCASREGQRMVSPGPTVSRRSTATGTIQTNTLSPGLPTLIRATNSPPRRSTIWVFYASPFTNHMGLALPLKGGLDEYASSIVDPWCEVSFETLQVNVPAIEREFVPELDPTKDTLVTDRTHAGEPDYYTARFRTNRWPTDAEVHASAEERVGRKLH
jgi:hypothetical protein